MLSKRQIPNLLTFARVAAVPACLVLILYAPKPDAWLFGLFVAASITDFLDGYLARKWNATSPLGALLDPVADKLLVALMLIYLLIAMGGSLLLPVTIIILRELYISGLREFLAARRITLPVSKGGKWKTAMQMLAITLLLAVPMLSTFAWVGWVGAAGMALLYLSALLAFTSAAQYTRSAAPHFRTTGQ